VLKVRTLIALQIICNTINVAVSTFCVTITAQFSAVGLLQSLVT